MLAQPKNAEHPPAIVEGSGFLNWQSDEALSAFCAQQRSGPGVGKKAHSLGVFSPSSVAFVRENDLFFAADPKCFTIETAGLGRFLRDRAVRWIPTKPVQLPPLLTPNF